MLLVRDHLPPELSVFFRALVTLEGALRTLAPGYLAIDSAQRIAAEWARESLTVATVRDQMQSELLRLVPVLRRLPTHVERLAGQLERGQLQTRVSLFAHERDVRAVTTPVNRAVLAFLGGLVALLSAILLGVKGGPPFTGDTTLFQFFGYFGLFCGTVLILRVLVAVLHDGVN